jgi:hypothetical protein
VALWAFEGFRISNSHYTFGDRINPIDHLQGAECDEKGEDYRCLNAAVQLPTGGRALSQKFLNAICLVKLLGEQEPRQKEKKKTHTASPYHHPESQIIPQVFPSQISRFSGRPLDRQQLSESSQKLGCSSSLLFGSSTKSDELDGSWTQQERDPRGRHLRIVVAERQASGHKQSDNAQCRSSSTGIVMNFKVFDDHGELTNARGTTGSTKVMGRASQRGKESKGRMAVRKKISPVTLLQDRDPGMVMIIRGLGRGVV